MINLENLKCPNCSLIGHKKAEGFRKCMNDKCPIELFTDLENPTYPVKDTGERPLCEGCGTTLVRDKHGLTYCVNRDCRVYKQV